MKWVDSDTAILANGAVLDDIQLISMVEDMYENKIIENMVNYPLNHFTVVDLAAEYFYSSLFWCPEYHRFYHVKLNGMWGSEEDDLYTYSMLRKYLQALGFYAADFRDRAAEAGFVDQVKDAAEFYKFIMRLSNNQSVERLMRDLHTCRSIASAKLDNNPCVIGTPRGVYDMKSGRILDNDSARSNFVTRKCAVDIPISDNFKKNPRWEKFIREIMCEDEAKIDYLQRALGYSVMGVNSEECMFVAYGAKTRNGKGTLFNTIVKALGEYAATMDAGFITEGAKAPSYGDANPALVALNGKRFVTMSEPREGARLDEALVKTLTGNDAIRTRQLYGKSFEFVPAFTMWISCNSLPAVNDASVFSSGRMKVITFDRHFSATEQDKNLKMEFAQKDVLQTVLVWLMEGYRRYLERGLEEPEAISVANKGYSEENDRVALFLSDCCYVGKGDYEVPSPKLYRRYKQWCEDNGVYPISAQRFTKDLKKKGIEKSKTIKGVRYYVGATLK